MKAKKKVAKKVAKPTPVKVLVIDRRVWGRGTVGSGATLSRLLHPRTGKMCCMGIYGRALGVPRAKLLDKDLPVSANERERRVDDVSTEAASQWPAWLFQACKVQGEKVQRRSKLAHLNDEKAASETEREEQIAREFKKYGGVTVKFIG